MAQFLESSLLRGSFNGGILVAKNGVIVYENYKGFRDFRTKDSLLAETPLQIASTSKTFTGVAIMRLAQEGKLRLDAPLQEFFPGFPYPDVNVQLLLNHRSGLPNYLYFLEEELRKKKVYITNTDVLNALLTQQPPRAFRPNTRFQYCNTNYVLLALILEKVTGQTYPEYMKDTYFEPLGMSHTYVFTMADTARSVMSFNAGGGLWPMDYFEGTYGDKNIFSTPRDLLKWDQALYSGELLNQQMLDSAFTPYSNERPSEHNYGLGWRLLNLPNGKKAIYHNGRWHGFNAAFGRLTEERATVIILGNRFNSSIYQTARKLYNFFGPYGRDGSATLEEGGQGPKE
ncbi:MAG TPA: serine hydrolase domain-containing protein [Chitinophagaceae bacterium]|nr:serine hydrolase domain-containing protein [Chitinophagaceae bacterium]